MKTKTKSAMSWTLAWILGIFWTVIALIPFVFMVLNSFKDKFEMLSSGVFALPKKLNLDNYKAVLEGNFVKYFMNSVIVLAISLILLLLISACASYPLSRFKFKLANPIYALVVACMSIPIHITLIPVFKMSKDIGIYDTIWSN